jgi:hypothetical protein
MPGQAYQVRIYFEIISLRRSGWPTKEASLTTRFRLLKLCQVAPAGRNLTYFLMQLLFDKVIIPVVVHEVRPIMAQIIERVNFRIAPSVLNRALSLIDEPLL